VTSYQWNPTADYIERVKADSDRDNFMNAEAAKAYGLVDKVIEKRPDGAPAAPA